MSTGRARKRPNAAPDWPTILAGRAESASSEVLGRFYSAGCVEPDRPLADTPLVALDLETTGLNPESHSIVSFGLVPFSLTRIRCRESHYRVVQPRRDPAPESVTIHHITHSEMARAPDIAELLESLLDMLAGRIVVVHYRPIERRFLDAAARSRLGEGLVFPVLDTMALEARRHPRRKPGVIGRWLGRKPVSLRLAACRQRYNLPHYAPHHALTDALATAELFQAQVAHAYTPDTPVGALWS
ncbi:3'-5' exonuclease [Wenzhouxiangella sp. AB-CW3]|uniref:3'-5' exonuclease n=1 Tax=Wenzhouxiangella sp. AB-CW3 TaxID=2771012 RepID=UPI00168A909C|nr:3'-5' exonuclease [Wenzhouxiangella sp. AB-CW3]QOC22440.1 3'-5' exonuclease [Wenzhouxiangella sp. AB-CW3]